MLIATQIKKIEECHMTVQYISIRKLHFSNLFEIKPMTETPLKCFFQMYQQSEESHLVIT
jgi:hypothetical protein